MSNDLNDLIRSYNRILVLAPHPDDESLGCGGTIAHYTKMGKEICVAFISKGDAVEIKVDNVVEVRRAEAKKAAEILGIKHLVFMDFPDAALNQHYDKIKQSMRDVIDKYNPDIVFSPSPIDLHNDHIVVSKIIRDLLREFHSFLVAFYEIYTPIRYNSIVDITETIDIKERAVLCYQCSSLGNPANMFGAMKGLNASKSFAVKKEGFYEVFFVISAENSEDEIIDWLTYGLCREASSYLFLSKLKKVDQLLGAYQQSLTKINELSALLKEKENKIEELAGKDFNGSRIRRWFFGKIIKRIILK